MKDISSFDERERMFLAGCIKNIIMADRQFDDEEMNELDQLLGDMNFSDYEESLEDFESEVQDSDSFWKMAETIDNEDTQDLVLEILYDLSMQNGLAEPAENKLISKLQTIWNV